MIHITTLTFNPFQENTYIIWDDSKDCWIIDPGCYSEKENNVLVEHINANKLKPVKLIHTHCHIDHIFGNQFVCDKYNLLPEIHKSELPILQAGKMVSEMYGVRYNGSPMPAKFWEEGDELLFNGKSLEIRFTPGHSPGSICFINHEQKWVIAGDVVFYGSIGRTDLPMGDYDTLIKSIHDKILTLPDDYTIYSGHGPETTVGRERKSNPFLLSRN
jgi:glyoxylase-like metal-dependent hydrolase (beta-lactamase superfamily II)